MEDAAIVLSVARWWLYAGGIVAVLFLGFGIDRIDENARGSYIFRPLLVPGILLIWPLVLWRWLKLERNHHDISGRYNPLRQAHGPTWMVLAFLIPTLFLGALALRQTWPKDAPATLLAPPAGAAQR